MKKGVKFLEDKDIMEILSYRDIQIQIPQTIDDKIISRIRQKSAQKPVASDKIISRRRLLVAAIFFIMLCIPAFLIINNFSGLPGLVVTDITPGVIFLEYNKTILLKRGDLLQDNYKIKTGTQASCQVQYGKTATMTINESTDIDINEYNKKRLFLGLNKGDILINEKRSRNPRIEIKTPCAYVYAIGTRYSIMHNINREETIIKVFEGIVHIETIPAGKEIILEAGNEIIIKQPKDGNEKEIDYSISELKKEWFLHPVYLNPRLSETIKVFAVSNDIVVSITEHSVVCLENKEILWETILKNEQIIAAPVIWDTIAYVPAKSGILRFDIQTGKQKPTIILSETFNTDLKIVEYKGILYVVLVTGIYIIDTAAGLQTNEPVIPCFGIMNPLFHGDNMYTFSYLTYTIEALSITGKSLWSVPLDEISYCQPVFIDNFIYIGANNGNVYKISDTGNIIKTLQTGGAVPVIKNNNDNSLFVQTGVNKVLNIDRNSFEIKEVFDTVTAFTVFNNFLILGTTAGSIIIHDFTTGVEKEMQLLYDSHVTAFINQGNRVFAGLKNNTIVKLEYR